MQTHEIPSEQWGPFLDKITRRHEGQQVSIEIEGADLGAQPQARGMRLIGITFDPKEAIGQEIDVIVRNDAEVHLMHAIPHPSHLWIAQTEQGQDRALQVQSAEGPTTLVRFNIEPPLAQQQKPTSDNSGKPSGGEQS